MIIREKMARRDEMVKVKNSAKEEPIKTKSIKKG